MLSSSVYCSQNNGSVASWTMITELLLLTIMPVVQGVFTGTLSALHRRIRLYHVLEINPGEHSLPNRTFFGLELLNICRFSSIIFIEQLKLDTTISRNRFLFHHNIISRIIVSYELVHV